jgi:hypothetical protein
MIVSVCCHVEAAEGGELQSACDGSMVNIDRVGCTNIFGGNFIW